MARKQREKGQGQDIPFQGMPPVTYFLQVGPLYKIQPPPNNATKL
jgi:hypothetical protein